MAKRKRAAVEEHENHERWLVSYADFITLLFAFFVVMYSISQVNEGKYRVLAKTLDSVFNDDPLSIMKTPALTLDPIQFGDPVMRPRNPDLGIELPDNGGDSREDDNDLNEEQEDIKKVIESGFSELIKGGLLDVSGNKNRLEIELKSKILFEPGGAILQFEAEHVLSHLAIVLSGYENQILVEGHTDNIPIKTYHFPSNWEVSSARSAAVVNLFAREGIEPKRMSVVGYGEFRPIADNQTKKGQQRNRRVVIVVMKNSQKRNDFDLEKQNVKEVENISLLEESFEELPQVDIVGIIEEKIGSNDDVNPIESGSSDAGGLFLLPGVQISTPNQNTRKSEYSDPSSIKTGLRDNDQQPDKPSSSSPVLRAVPLEGGGMIFKFDSE
ncbi:MAG: flagellar motor protein MotD [Proteobacteria bacterium]|nr:flagellar motor protein MotD [Pseudomonadota bacterium]